MIKDGIDQVFPKIKNIIIHGYKGSPFDKNKTNKIYFMFSQIINLPDSIKHDIVNLQNK